MLMVGVLTYHSFFFLFFFLRNRPIIQGRVMFQKKNAYGWSFDPSFKVQWCSKKNAYGLWLEFWPIIQGTVMFQKKCSRLEFWPIIQGAVMFQKSFDPSFKVQWCLSSGALLKVVYRLLHPHSIRHVIVNLTTTCLDSFLTKEGNIAMASFYILFVEKMLTNG